MWIKRDVEARLKRSAMTRPVTNLIFNLTLPSRLRKKSQTVSEVPTRAKARNFIAQCLSGFENPLPGLKSGATPGPAFFRSLLEVNGLSVPPQAG
jgi:hypothetical protein